MRKNYHPAPRYRSRRTVQWLLICLVIGMGMLVGGCTTPLTIDQEQIESSATIPPEPAIATMVPEGKLGETGSQWAFIRDQVLYIHSAGQEIPIEDCGEGRCAIYYPSWSPGGQYLLYYVQMQEAVPVNLIRVATLDGTTQTLTDQAANFRPAGWAPDGEQVVYFQSTGRIREEESLLGLNEIYEVWIATIEHEGEFEHADPPRELMGEIGFGTGCGGGGRSESANVYEREGGFAYGYLAGVTVWAADDILLYSNNCTSRGVGRFDLRSGAELDPYPAQLRSLAVNAARDAWVAIDETGKLVQGVPDTLETMSLENQEPAELVYWGHNDDTFYYTTLVTTYTVDLSAQIGGLSGEIWVSPYFDEAAASIRRYTPATAQDDLIWSGNDYAYARLWENANGELFFSAVEPGDRLAQAIRENALTPHNWRAYLPSVRVEMITFDTRQPIQLFDHAEAYTVWQ